MGIESGASRARAALTMQAAAVSSVRTVLPLSILTCTSMLAMDLFLPAVPSLQRALSIDIAVAQATISVFLAGLAASQLLWAEALTAWGPRRSAQWSVWLLVIGGIGCALAPDARALLMMRLVQGIGAGAAPVIAPSVVRATLPDADAVRGIAAIAMVESIVPAAGPILGAALLTRFDWRGTFWILSAVALLVLPFVVRVTPKKLPGLNNEDKANYGQILRNRKYRRLALSHALSVGAILTFVASAPQLMVHALGKGASAFALLQVCGVAAFMIFASQSGRVSQRLGVQRAIQVAAWAQVILCALLLIVSVTIPASWLLIAIFWGAFCGALAIRGPAAFSEALKVPPAQLGRASAILVLAILSAGAVGTQVIAPFLASRSAAPLAAGLLLLSLISAAGITAFPAKAAT